MAITESELIAIGSIANFFGTRYGAYNIDTLLKSFGIKDVSPYNNKTGKIAHVLRKFVNNPQAFCGFMTALLSIHSLTKENVSLVNSYLKTLGYQIKGGMVTTTAIEDIINFVKLPPDLAEESHRMAEAYIVLFFLENELRTFIEKKMKETYGVDWWKMVPLQIRRNCEKRKEQEEKSPWHEVKEASLLWYTTFDELQHIIQTNWKVFKNYFKDQYAIIGRLSELEIPRNTIAHNRILESTELERLRVFSRDILKVIAKTGK